MVKVGWITETGNTTREQKRVAGLIEKLYVKLLAEFRIRRFIPLYLVDERSWMNKSGLNMHPQSVAHYNTGIRFKSTGVVHEAILLRESVLNWEDWHAAIPKILRHELSHAKLKDKEGKSNQHGKLFRETAKKHGAAQIGDY